MIVYNKKTKEFKSIIPIDQKPRKYNDILEEDIESIPIQDIELPNDNMNYYLIDDINKRAIRRPESEIEELKKYRRILTYEERLNILLQPSPEEISKAESTLEMLTMLQEVGLI